jgi:hypothetical protein
MCLKNKIVAAMVCAFVTGIGIFSIDANIAQATTANNVQNTTSTIEQLQQIVQSLIQQIQILIQEIAILKPQETCGNGICRFGETATNCPADCKNLEVNCAKEGEELYSCKEGKLCDLAVEKKCCTGLFSQNINAKMMPDGSCDVSGSGSALIAKKCVRTTCGNKICEAGENKCNCPADCATPPIVGGNCTYKDFPGTCTITQLVTPNGGGFVTANYTFTPSGSVDVSGTFLQSASQINPYSGNTSTSGLTPGMAFNCTLSVEMTGTCTPIIATFKDPVATCYKEREGIFGYISSNTAILPCCPGLISKPRTTCIGTLCGTVEGFICQKATPTCGNGICETGEENPYCPSNASCVGGTCPKDCPAYKCYGQGEGVIGTPTNNNGCCVGLTQVFRNSTSTESPGGFICIKTGDDICGAGENNSNSPFDCR